MEMNLRTFLNRISRDNELKFEENENEMCQFVWREEKKNTTQI